MTLNLDISTTLAELMEIAPAGFAIGLHVRFTTPTFMFQTYPKAWLEEYSREGLLLQDPMVAWAFANTGHVAWADLAPADEQGVLRRAAAHGLAHGVAVSLLRGGSRSMGGFARSDRPFTPEEVERIESAMASLHDSTDSAQPLPESLREALRRLSVAFTHP